MAREFVPSADERQVQPAGVDLRVESIEVLRGPGFIGEEKKIPGGEEVKPTPRGWVLAPGAYRVRFRDVVRVPPDAVGICFPRSSLLRMGATVSCAVWDPGYVGKGQALLVVFNDGGIVVEKDARLAQIVFVRLVEVAKVLYRGTYYGEGLEG